MTPDEIELFIARRMLADLYREAGFTRDDIHSWHRNGIPVEWATKFCQVTGLPIDAWPKLLHPPRLLHNRSQASRVTSNMTPEHKLAISEGRTGRDKFTAKIRAAKPKGYSQNALAKALGIKPSLLSMYRTGERKIPLARAQRVQELTGWPADAAHWPGGILSDA